MRMRLMVLVLLVGLLAGCTNAAPTVHPTEIVPTLAPEPTLNPAGDAPHGAALFTEWQCAHCHGEGGEGQLGPSLAGTTLSEVSFRAAVRQTRPPKPAFSEAELSDADVRDILVWLQTLQPASAAVGEQSDELLGIQVYTGSGCDSCHGAFAQGGEAPLLVGYADDADTFLQIMTDTSDAIPEHSLEEIDAGLMRRLHGWLQEGANLDSGC